MRKLYAFYLLILLMSVLTGCERNPGNTDNSLKLWYRQPASVWEEALPVGNGRLGAMVFGDPVHERLQINEESIWAGSKINNNNPDALKTLPVLQKALFESRYKDALKLADENFLGTPPRVRSYQPFGDLYIDYEWNDTPENYSRELDLETGIATTRFTVGGKRIIQEVFASAPENILVIHISSEDGLAVNASFNLNRKKDAVVRAKDKILELTGQIIDQDDPKSGPGGEHMKFAGELRLTSKNGSAVAGDSCLIVKNAGDIVIRLTAATDYNINKLDYDRSIDPSATCKSILDRTEGVPFKDLKKSHLEEYQKIFNRVSLSFGVDSLTVKPTDERLAALKNGAIDNGLIALYFQYGRYLLMSSSRAPGSITGQSSGNLEQGHECPLECRLSYQY